MAKQSKKPRGGGKPRGGKPRSGPKPRGGKPRSGPKRPEATPGPARRIGRALLLWGARLALLMLVAPPLQVALLLVVDPPVTATMLQRTWEGREEGVRLPDRAPIALDALPIHVPQAYVGSEDARFFSHNGFDVAAIESAWKNYRSGGALAGGSTISQQVAKNVFLWQGRSWLRKGLEVWYTLWLELIVPKERILEVYLNVAESGPMTFGIEAGARRWFGIGAAALTPRQAALLASMLPNPRGWTPETERVRRRAARLVLQPAPMPEDFGTR